MRYTQIKVNSICFLYITLKNNPDAGFKIIIEELRMTYFTTYLFIFSLCSTRSYMETKGWDVFRVLPPEQDSSSEAINQKCLAWTVRILKVIAYVLSFCIGKKHALKKYDQFALNTSCICVISLFHEILFLLKQKFREITQL